jgi:hypothetical protein
MMYLFLISLIFTKGCVLVNIFQNNSKFVSVYMDRIGLIAAIVSRIKGEKKMTKVCSLGVVRSVEFQIVI